MKQQCIALQDRAQLIDEIATECASLAAEDKRAVAIAITHLETASMWMLRGAYGTRIRDIE